jgi:hypothetical protein
MKEPMPTWALDSLIEDFKKILEEEAEKEAER